MDRLEFVLFLIGFVSPGKVFVVFLLMVLLVFSNKTNTNQRPNINTSSLRPQKQQKNGVPDVVMVGLGIAGFFVEVDGPGKAVVVFHWLLLVLSNKTNNSNTNQINKNKKSSPRQQPQHKSKVSVTLSWTG